MELSAEKSHDRKSREALRIELDAALRPLAVFFTGSEEGQSGKLYFEETLDAFEYELALHCLCNFLLKDVIQTIDSNLVDRISHIHSMMQLEDDCVEELQRMTPKP